MRRLIGIHYNAGRPGLCGFGGSERREPITGRTDDLFISLTLIYALIRRPALESGLLVDSLQNNPTVEVAAGGSRAAVEVRKRITTEYVFNMTRILFTVKLLPNPDGKQTKRALGEGAGKLSDEEDWR
ncbi:hypothetical protein Trydic_g10609 [Trypoxylus dichotomus]